MSDGGPMLGAGWYPDPYDRHERRFHDGSRWTPYCADGDEHSLDDPMAATGEMPAAPLLVDRQERPGEGLARPVAPHPTPTTAPTSAPTPEPAAAVGTGRSLLTEPVLVVRRRAAGGDGPAYDVCDEGGQPLGRATRSGRLVVRPTLWKTISGEKGGRCEVVDHLGARLLTVVGGQTTAKQAAVAVEDATGQVLGRLVEQRGTGRPLLGIEIDGRFSGYARAVVDPSAPSAAGAAGGFVVEDVSGQVVARTDLPSRPEEWTVRLDDGLAGPLRAIAVAVAVAAEGLLGQH